MTRRLTHKAVAPIALEIEKRGEIGVLHLRVRLRRDHGLRAVGDAKARRLQHGEIVGAIAHRDDIAGVKAMRGGLLFQRGELGLAPEDRLGHSREAAALPQKNIRAITGKARARRDRSCEEGEPSRYEHRMRAMRVHGLAPASARQN